MRTDDVDSSTGHSSLGDHLCRGMEDIGVIWTIWTRRPSLRRTRSLLFTMASLSRTLFKLGGSAWMCQSIDWMWRTRLLSVGHQSLPPIRIVFGENKHVRSPLPSSQKLVMTRRFTSTKSPSTVRTTECSCLHLPTSNRLCPLLKKVDSRRSRTMRIGNWAFLF